MKTTLKLLVFLFALCATAGAQVEPEAMGPGLPVSGTLHFDARYAQSAQFGGGEGSEERSIASADAGYTNTSKRLPFTLQYGGGYSWDWTGGSSQGGGVFQHLALSQGIVGRSWNLTASDNVSYSFETPTTGFSGVPGSGEPIGGTGSPTPPDQTILALNTRTLDNAATAQFGHRLNHATTLNIGGSATQLLYIDDNGQNTDMLMANAEITHRLDAHNSIAGQYSFARFTFGANSTLATLIPQVSSIQVNTLEFAFAPQWTRHISANVSAGPQWISSSDSSIEPSSTNVAVSASISDSFRFGAAGLTYSHGLQGGGGYLQGGETDIAGANFSREFERKLTVGLTASYMRTAGLAGNGVTNSKYGGAQATRQLGRYLNVFASYTALDQSSSSVLNGSALSGLTHVIGFGIGYSPRETHLRR
jgi:hypothetical protein